MAESLHDFVGRLIREMYRPFDEIAELVRCFGEAALVVTEASGAEIAVQSTSDEADLHVSLGRQETRRASASQRVFFPIRYQRAEVGRLSILQSSLSLGDASTQACSWIAKTLGYHLKRYEVSQLARELQGRNVSFIGTSEPLGRVDYFVEQASRTSLPAVIQGKSGSQPEHVALALHLMGSTRDNSFVQANCETLEGGSFEEHLLQLLRRADGGTLLLARLGKLDLRSQLLLCQILETGVASWTAERCGQPLEVRFLATATRDLDGMVQRGEFSGDLLGQIDFLRLEIEPLRNRREDIPPLVDFYLRQHACGEVPEISEEVMEACVDYDWPGDVSELSRVMARLVIMTENDRVLPQHVHAYAPQILGRPESACLMGNPTEPSDETNPALNEQQPEDFLTLLETSHPSLQRAVSYIAANYQQKLSLASVATVAHSSASHLAHLFQQDLGTTFTRFLATLRVARVKQFLLEHPRKAITTIAAEAGFSDLSHFERTFKNAVGCTPREFRRLAGVRRTPQ